MDYGGLILVCFHMRGAIFGDEAGGNFRKQGICGGCERSVNKWVFSFLSAKRHIIIGINSETGRRKK